MGIIMEKIAMKCNSKQFKHIKPKLKKAGVNIFMISDFKEGCYLCFFSDKSVTNGVIQFRNIYTKIYDEWDEETFLKICGVEPKEKTYKIKQETGMDSITINDVKYIKEDKDSYKITREQIFELCMPSLKTNRERFELIFPEVFETKLTVGKWYKDESDPNLKYFVLYKGKGNACGFFRGKWEESLFFNTDKNRECTAIEATEQEVTEVLIKEVKKRYKAGDYVEKIHRFSNKYITGNNPGIVVDSDYKVWYGGCIVFKDGQWAEIIPTLSTQQAEEKLKELGVNAKIV